MIGTREGGGGDRVERGESMSGESVVRARGNGPKYVRLIVNARQNWASGTIRISAGRVSARIRAGMGLWRRSWHLADGIDVRDRADRS